MENFNWIDGQIIKQALNISDRTLQRWRKNGTIPFSHIGGKILFNMLDIEKILKDNYTMFRLKHNVK